jgi:hypothetical protein
MDINEMTDEALHALAQEVEAKERARAYATHVFGGIDGRCFGCDVRPSSRYADEPCPTY